MRIFTTRFALALAATLIASAASAKEISNADLSPNPTIQTGQIVAIINDVFAGEPQWVIDRTIRIAMCESGLRDEHGRAIGLIIHVMKDGSIRKGEENPNDTGALQINKTTHTADWTRPLDPKQIQDNIVYAYKLQQGRINAGEDRFKDWTPSQGCWKHEPVTMAYASS